MYGFYLFESLTKFIDPFHVRENVAIKLEDKTKEI